MVEGADKMNSEKIDIQKFKMAVFEKQKRLAFQSVSFIIEMLIALVSAFIRARLKSSRIIQLWEFPLEENIIQQWDILIAKRLTLML